ncbi:hypothetical protein BDZ89DRAFT_1048062 [Hymenopellis radicata]|nr:hypothetical protein BDZ89DRAFT_1048062 [Hymenopellis radicata]
MSTTGHPTFCKVNLSYREAGLTRRTRVLDWKVAVQIYSCQLNVSIDKRAFTRCAIMSSTPSDELHTLPSAAPFDSIEKTDLVVRSSDGVHFFVVKAFLIYHSEFFANLLKDSVPQEQHKGLPMFNASEDSHTMRMVLKLCYPLGMAEDDIGDIMGCAAVRSALRKYMMEDGEARYIAAVSSAGYRRLMKTDPLRCYVLGRSMRLDELARAAAKETLRLPFHDRKAFKELALIDALDYQRLLDYFRSCGEVVTTQLSTLSLSPYLTAMDPKFKVIASGSSHCHSCPERVTAYRIDGGSYVHAWVMDAIKASHGMVREWRSAGFLDDECWDRILAGALKSCSSQTPEGVRVVLNAINFEIDRLVSQVQLQLD